ncbi:MAG: DUF4920 domain-containing protein [Candidatus Eisenbacteria bacterium]|nr:DUF4920 domain-containing protein [Candidatus Eisenbacteria bacterium]
MKSIKWVAAGVLVAALAGCATKVRAQETQASVPEAKTPESGQTGPLAVGAKITVKAPVSISRLAANPAKFSGKTVRLEGTVKAVCQGRGCWVEVESGGKSFMARSLDETVLLPKDCAGRKIVVQGVVKQLPQEAMEEPAPKDHVCPKPKYVVATQGAILL